MRWLLNLAEGGSLLTLMGLPDAEPTIDLEIPDTDLIATCIVSLVLDVIVIERIGRA